MHSVYLLEPVQQLRLFKICYRNKFRPDLTCQLYILQWSKWKQWWKLCFSFKLKGVKKNNWRNVWLQEEVEIIRKVVQIRNTQEPHLCRKAPTSWEKCFLAHPKLLVLPRFGSLWFCHQYLILLNVLKPEQWNNYHKIHFIIMSL